MPRRKGQPRDTFVVPFPVRPDWPVYPVVTPPPPPPPLDFDLSQGLTQPGIMRNISTTSFFIPGYLIDYYNRRALISIAGELQNAEIQIAAVDEGGNPLEQAAFVYLANAHTDACMRLSSERREISGYLRKAQHLVLTCWGRKIVNFMPEPTDSSIFVPAPLTLRHVTMTLLLGELPP